jgi:hypothetical protein
MLRNNFGKLILFFIFCIMYIFMNIVIFGEKIRISHILIAAAILAIVGSHTLFSCVDLGFSSNLTEGFQLEISDKLVPQNSKQFDSKPEANPRVKVPSDELHFFAENKFAPECCPSSYSSSTGCACMTPEQLNYLNTRGGNRTLK